MIKLWEDTQRSREALAVTVSRNRAAGDLIRLNNLNRAIRASNHAAQPESTLKNALHARRSQLQHMSIESLGQILQGELGKLYDKTPLQVTPDLQPTFIKF